MLHLLSELLGLNRGRIVLADGVDVSGAAAASATGPSAIRFVYGLTQAEMARGRYAAGEGITGAVLATGQAIIAQDIDAEPRFLARAVTRDRLPQETVAFIALPIEVNRRTVGVLGVHRIRRRHRLLNDDVALLKILATLAGQLLQLRSLVDEKTRALEARNALLTRALESAAARYGIIGTSPALLQALGELERVSQASASVLLLGESGSGKELFARAVHLASLRRDAPFIKVNCAAIPDTLFESELFGHERGAFTGANTCVEPMEAIPQSLRINPDPVAHVMQSVLAFELRITLSAMPSIQLVETDQEAPAFRVRLHGECMRCSAMDGGASRHAATRPPFDQAARLGMPGEQLTSLPLITSCRNAHQIRST